MTTFWFVCDGQVEEYDGQKANWDNQVVVCAESPLDALTKVLFYYRGTLKRQDVKHNGTIITALP